MLGDPNPPQAFCCVTDDLAVAVELAVLDCGRSIPEEVAVISCDTTWGDPIPAERAPVPITTVDTRSKDIWQPIPGLIEQYESAPTSSTPQLIEPILVPSHLTVRASCGAGNGRPETTNWAAGVHLSA
jgi:DNA-binding LacI/PurR family transcriptional regulator